MRFFETISHLFHPQRSNNHRPRVLHPESLLSLVGISLGFGLFIIFSGRFNSHLGNVLGYASNISTTDVISQTNAERAKGGLAPLQYNEKLAQAATAKANDMFSKQYWAHVSPEGVEPWAWITSAGYNYTAAGENLARDFDATPDMMAAWMASPTHAANIMNARYEEIGVAVVNGNLEGIDTTLVVQMFGRPTAAPVVAAIEPKAAQTQKTVSIAQQTPAPTTKPVVSATPRVATPAPSSITEASPLPTIIPTPVAAPAVLAEVAVPVGSLARESLFTPLQLTKAFGLSVLLLVVATLCMDWFISHKRGTVRLVGKNFAHILFFSAICFVLIIFRGGFVF